jgi:hypothetical protein
MAEMMVFFNAGLRCWIIQNAGWSVKIAWNWNGSCFSERKMAGPDALTSLV